MTTTPAWLLLIHQIPSQPPYFRVKVGRRLQQIGAVAVKSSVYALPNREVTRESFQWLLREILAEGGEAMICAAAMVEGMGDDELQELFRAARRGEYEQVAEEARTALASVRASGEDAGAGAGRLRAEHGRLQRRLEKVREIDFFAAGGREVAEEALRRIAEELEPPSAARPQAVRAGDLGELRGRTWVTRPGVKEDRIASAWLIRRFIDPEATFRFADRRASDGSASGEISYDTYGGDFTHEGDHCTFEVLLRRAGLDDPALAAIAEIIHDLDLKDDKFRRPEAPGVQRLIAGICAAHARDEDRLENGRIVLEALFAGLGGAG